jgi:hypothetical protein
MMPAPSFRILADHHHHRIQPARHGQQMAHHAVLVIHVQVPSQFPLRDAAVPGGQLTDRGHAGVEPVDIGVDLNPVACRDREDLGHSSGARQVR